MKARWASMRRYADMMSEEEGIAREGREKRDTEEALMEGMGPERRRESA